MVRIYEKNKLTFSLILIITYVVVSMLADNFSVMVGYAKVVTAPVLILFTLFLFYFLKRNQLSKEYGLCSFKGQSKIYLYFIPLIVMASSNLWNGVELNGSIVESTLFVVSMLCVGFIEEIIFRGFLFKAMCKNNVKVAILVSSVLFGVGHIINLLSGSDLVLTILQICYASAVGFLFTIIYYKGKSLVPCIIAHGIINSLSYFAIESSLTFSIISSAVLCVISIAYALWILKSTEKFDKE